MNKRIFIIFVTLYLITTIAIAKPIINSVGNPDIAKYKTFTIINTSLPNTPEFLRNLPILQNLVFRFQQEGFEFVDNIDDADFAASVFFIDAVGQEYVPPRTYTSINYNSGPITTHTTGMASTFGNFVNFQATSQSASTGSATATTTTTGGYFVPNYGIALALNIYDTKSQQLVWSGAGASKASVNNIYPTVDDIIVGIIDDHLITPTYLKGERKKIRKEYEAKYQNEYLKPSASPEKIGFYQVDYKEEIDGVGIICRISREGQLLVGSLSFKNNTDKDILFNPGEVEIKFKNKNLYLYSKSEVAGLMFKTGSANISEATPREGRGLLSGLLLSPLQELFGTSPDALRRKRDKSVRFTYDNYLDKHSISPKEHYLGYLYAVAPVNLSNGEKISIIIPLEGKKVEAEFLYEKGWMTFAKFKRKFDAK